MPSNVVHTKRDEEKWDKAEEIAKDEGKGGNYAYIMGIYKRMNPSHDFDKKSCFRVAAEVFRKASLG